LSQKGSDPRRLIFSLIDIWKGRFGAAFLFYAAIRNYADHERSTLGLIELKSGEKLSRHPQFGANPPSLAENAVGRFPPETAVALRQQSRRTVPVKSTDGFRLERVFQAFLAMAGATPSVDIPGFSRRRIRPEPVVR
jgi:hypothetical protein